MGAAGYHLGRGYLLEEYIKMLFPWRTLKPVIGLYFPFLEAFPFHGALEQHAATGVLF